MDDILLVEITSRNGSTLLTVTGEIDASSMLALQAPLNELSVERHVVVDMSGVRFMDSSGLKVILGQQLRMLEHGGSLQIRNPSPAVHRVLVVTGLVDTLCEPQQAATS